MICDDCKHNREHCGHRRTLLSQWAHREPVHCLWYEPGVTWWEIAAAVIACGFVLWVAFVVLFMGEPFGGHE